MVYKIKRNTFLHLLDFPATSRISMEIYFNYYYVLWYTNTWIKPIKSTITVHQRPRLLPTVYFLSGIIILILGSPFYGGVRQLQLQECGLGVLPLLLIRRRKVILVISVTMRCQETCWSSCLCSIRRVTSTTRTISQISFKKLGESMMVKMIKIYYWILSVNRNKLGTNKKSPNTQRRISRFH